MTTEQSGADLAIVDASTFLYFVFLLQQITANLWFIDENRLYEASFIHSSNIEHLPYAGQCSGCWEHIPVRIKCRLVSFTDLTFYRGLQSTEQVNRQINKNMQAVESDGKETNKWAEIEFAGEMVRNLF